MLQMQQRMAIVVVALVMAPHRIKLLILLVIVPLIRLVLIAALARVIKQVILQIQHLPIRLLPQIKQQILLPQTTPPHKLIHPQT